MDDSAEVTNISLDGNGNINVNVDFTVNEVVISKVLGYVGGNDQDAFMAQVNSDIEVMLVTLQEQAQKVSDNQALIDGLNQQKAVMAVSKVSMIPRKNVPNDVEPIEEQPA